MPKTATSTRPSKEAVSEAFYKGLVDELVGEVGRLEKKIDALREEFVAEVRIEARVDGVQSKAEVVQSEIVRVVEFMADHLHSCPGSTDEERIEVETMAARFKAALR